MRNLVLFAAAYMVLYSCNGGQFIKPNQAQIDTYITVHSDLSEFDKQLIIDGRFEMGMQSEAVKFLLGAPDKIKFVKQPWTIQERWIYTEGRGKIFIVEGPIVVGIEER